MKIQKRSRRSVATLLPDDVVMEILTRMPAHTVLKFRCVCQRWKDLISSQHFQEMHIKAKAYRSPMILVQKSFKIKNTYELLLLERWEQPRKRPTIRRIPPNFIDSSGTFFTEFRFSYDGLIVTRSSVTNGKWGITIMNPISGDVVKVYMPRSEFCVYGMFFDPLIKEYCVLLGTNIYPPVEFQIVNLGPQPCFRALKQSVFFPHMPADLFYRPPVVIDNATIYWLIDSRKGNFPPREDVIMAFDIKTEVFTFLPHPDPTYDCHSMGENDDCHSMVDMGRHIIDIDGCLSFVESKFPQGKTSPMINIWTLKDNATSMWIKTHSFSGGIGHLMVMGLVKGELLLRQYLHGGVYAYDLKLGTLRKIGKTHKNSHLLIYVPSFVSLRNCKPEIYSDTNS